MPSAVQIRRKRIKKLLEWARGRDREYSKIDPILHRAEDMFPLVSRKTCRSYSIAVLRLLKKRR